MRTNPLLNDRIEVTESRLRLQTLIRLRWVAVFGQIAAVLFVYLGLGFNLPLLECVTAIGIAALFNLALQIYFPPSKRLLSIPAMVMLAFDLLQLSILLYLTGGLQNPFSLLLVVPVAVSASTQPIRITIAVGTLAVLCASVLLAFHMPLPWLSADLQELPLLYKTGIWTALVCCIIFMGTYATRTAQENRKMSDALAATELVLAREQKLSALDGLAAAAAHELGTPLSTIALVATELERDVPKDSPLYEDVQLLRSQAARCREILGSLTANTEEQDAMYSQMSIGHLIEEVIEPYRIFDKTIEVVLFPVQSKNGKSATEPVISRNAGLMYALTNLVENAIDYARSKVVITGRWANDSIKIAITDDGPGIAPQIIRHLGEPYVTTRPRLAEKEFDGESEGMGLGFFIAKTLLERVGGNLTLKNKTPPATGAIIEINLRRDRLERATPYTLPIQ
ncbi:MAG: ActS/PrrB/RegB family redox-sensitive histidine kinase [Hyphomicrobiales bacterium]|nr:ActS/PrrB/RegB family redox-sensitive histidine kinase [Hyphomicrobiales bacterium]